MEESKTFGLFENGVKVTDSPEILFTRLDINEVLPKVEEMFASRVLEQGDSSTSDVEQTDSNQAKDQDELVVELKDEILYDDFDKLQFVVGEIIACEEVKKSKKLLCSQVKVGNQTKQIVSGIKAHYSAQEMVGKKVMVLLNLKPVTLAGVLSEGMLLCAEDQDGVLALMTPEKEMPSGASIC